MPAARGDEIPQAIARVFVSPSDDSPEHEEQVRAFWFFLRRSGIDARLNLPTVEEQRNWRSWTRRQLAAADWVVVVAPPAHSELAEDQAPNAPTLAAYPAA